VVAAAGVVVSMLALYAQLRRFQTLHPVLRTDEDLTAFKSLAAAQMYGSLVGLVLAWVPLALWAIGKFVFGVVGWLDALLFVALPFVIQLGVAAMTVGAARAVRATPSDDPNTKSERDRIVDIWLHRNLPNW